jgi:predicted dehydrogenase
MTGLRVVIVGAGLMGRWHAHYAVKAGAEVVAIVDRQPQAAAALQRGYPQAKVFPDLADSLMTCPVDVVHICTCLDSHVPLAEIALHAGKHVLLEKPAAGSEPETAQLVQLARRVGRNICAVHQFPFQRGFQRLRQQLNCLGELVRVTFHTCSAGGAGRTDAECRAILLEILPHPVSLFCSLLDQEIQQCAWTVLTFTNQDLEIAGKWQETQLSIQISLRGRPTRNALTVLGTRGTAHVDLFHGYCLLEAGTVSRTAKVLQPFRYGTAVLWAAAANLMRRAWQSEPAYPGLGELLERFYQSIRDETAAPIRADEMREVAALMDQVREAFPVG